MIMLLKVEISTLHIPWIFQKIFKKSKNSWIFNVFANLIESLCSKLWKNSWSIFSLGNFVLTESFKLNFLAADWLGSPRECFIMMWHFSLCQWHLLWSMCPVWDSAMLCHNIQPSVTTFKCGLKHSLTHSPTLRHCKDLEKERNFVLDKYCDFYFS